MNIDQPLLFVSFRLGNSKFGGVMSEYSEDKLRIIDQLGIKTFAVTSLDSVPIPRANVKYYRVPSLSLIELRAQAADLRACNQKLPIQFYIVLPFALTFGFILDRFLKIFYKSSLDGGFWGWSITSIPIVVYLKIRYKVKNLFATGGASAGIIGAVLHRMTGVNFYYEVPDPIVSMTMNYSVNRLKRIEKLESFLIRNSTKTIFNTEFAASLASKRCKESSEKITSIYPGAWKFTSQNNTKTDDKITFVHLGSLYGSRNLDLFLQALNELESLGLIDAGKIKIINIGTVHDLKPEYNLSKFELIFMTESKRESVLEFASKADILLLIQHNDLRSQATIPFKLYDYLNLRLPILGLVDNEEIEKLLVSHKDFLAPVGDINLIKIAIMGCIVSVRKAHEVTYTRIDSFTQFKKIFD